MSTLTYTTWQLDHKTRTYSFRGIMHLAYMHVMNDPSRETKDSQLRSVRCNDPIVCVGGAIKKRHTYQIKQTEAVVSSTGGHSHFSVSGAFVVQSSSVLL